jgi:hypothetical protein
VRLTFDLFGADPCGVRSEASARDMRAPCRAGSVGDAARRGLSGGGHGVASEASTRTTLEASIQFTEDRATAA